MGIENLIKIEKTNMINIVSLFIIQGSNAVLPLLIFPFVLSVVGEEYYSKLVITESLMFIVNLFVLYGFDVRGISNIIDVGGVKNPIGLSKAFKSITVSRLLILSVFVLIILLLRPFLEHDYFILLLLWMLYPLSYIFQSSYFFIALEKNINLVFSVVLSRLFCVLIVMNLIRSKSDFYLLPVIMGITYTLGSLSVFIYVSYKYKLFSCNISKQDIKNVLLDGKEIFYGNISVYLFKDLNVLILGLFASNVGIASYSIAEKLVKGIQAIIRPLNQFYFSKALFLIKNISTPNTVAFHKLKKVVFPQILFLLTILISSIFAYFVIQKLEIMNLSKYPNKDLIICLFFIMIPAVFFGINNFMYGTVGLNYLNEKKTYVKYLFSTGILSVIFGFGLIYFLAEIGASINFVLSEIILFIFVINHYLSKEKLK